ncbi:MAG: bifunctional [glutamate--ammonia ligase]-adenylyl-L-tyrosine phosphorylase/[glutamate--ammonia-ligase] adenylyltransferase [Methylococcales bacterium]|nr:bifunctional [glutamate--ammonia ligase]-adenylyl-L-tyrosine phosphorylase/[glutamate--ammonia-ligase] adenylyltransferase [Methylococcales bacterium]
MSFSDTPVTELDQLPEALRPAVSASLTRWQEQLAAQGLAFKPSPQLAAAWVNVWCASEFISESCLRRPALLLDLDASGDLLASYPEPRYAEKLAGLQPGDMAGLMQALRLFRRREMVRIAWRDLAGWAPLSETLAEVSWLADACIQYALAWLYTQACAKYGTPVLADGSPQQIIVLGMGKLGAYELNYSSDIDLIFAYAENGVLADRKATSYGEFFTRLCQQLVKVLDEITVEGFVFRTDIRLRPFGDSGPIIMTFDGMEHYYQTQAREWERYAMIKARQVAGDFNTGKQLMAMLQAFVYRRYLDYGAFEELRSLKAQITQELKRKDRMDNVKLGPGGIREVEFIGQAFQLIRGGNEKSLQTRGILDVLDRLGKLGLLTADDAAQLQQSYGFLRRVENHIQQYQDQQTHDLPTTTNVRQILAYSLDYPDWQTFKDHLDSVRANVHAVFDQVFSLSKQETQDQLSLQVWTGAAADDAQLLDTLTAYGFQQADESLMAIKHFKQSSPIRRLTNKGAKVLDRLMPLMIAALAQVDNPNTTLKRLLALFEAVAGRNVYLSLLAENPDALAQLLRLSSASPWICDYLSRYPLLFDELLDTRTLFDPLDKADLDAQLDALLATIDVQDLEQLMIVLRQFKQQNVLRVAAADIMGAIPVMVVSDYLTMIAESIVAHVVDRAWLMLTEKHGCPPAANGQSKGFAVLGLGKLGGIELGYGSDLDMVFLYDDHDGNALTDGEKPIASAQFYGRLGLKIRHILDTKMLSGVLYEVDMRLRPSGDSGLLVTHIKVYEDYFKNQAWTWEHQALVRGRFIAGDPRLKTAYEAIRHRILSLPRDTTVLKTEVREMRKKMREALDTKEAGQFDLKQSQGGIADIEFIVQFGVLALAGQFPELTVYTDNVRLLEGLQACQFMSPAQAETLKAAYCHYRDLGHKLVLQGEPTVINSLEVSDYSQQVVPIWHELMA